MTFCNYCSYDIDCITIFPAKKLEGSLNAVTGGREYIMAPIHTVQPLFLISISILQDHHLLNTSKPPWALFRALRDRLPTMVAGGLMKTAIWVIRVFQLIFAIILVGTLSYMIDQFRDYNTLVPKEVIIPEVVVCLYPLASLPCAIN
jgi:hypothetical protein